MRSGATWRIGDVVITRVQEYEGSGISWIVPEANPENLATIDWIGPFVGQDGKGRVAIQSLVIEDGDQRIVVDTCVGNDKQRSIPFWNMLQGPVPRRHGRRRLPSRVDRHGGVHASARRPRGLEHDARRRRSGCPRSRTPDICCHSAEWDHASNDPIPTRPPCWPIRCARSSRPVSWISSMFRYATGSIELIPTPGHTPGHMSGSVRSGGERAVITGDMMHHPSQIAHPEWRPPVDHDPDLAVRTRLAFLDEHADTPTLVIGTHFSGPTVGHIVRDGSTYRFDV